MYALPCPLRGLWRRAGLAALIAAALGCAKIEFTPTGTGGGGGGEASTSSGETTSTAGGGGEGAATSTSSSTCIPNCSPDRRCGDDGCMGLCGGIDTDETWGLRSAVSGLVIVPWPETQSVFFATDTTEVQRIDICTGETLATRSLDTASGPRPIRGLGRYGDQLLVAYNDPTPVGMEAKHAVLLDARTLTVNMPFDVGPVGEANGYWLGDASPTGLWLNLAAGGSFAFVNSEGDSCTAQFGDYDLSRGIAADANRVLAAWRPTNGSRFSLLDLSSCDEDCCAGAPSDPMPATGALPVSFEPRVLAIEGNQVFAAGFLQDPDPKPACASALRAGVLRADLAQAGGLPIFSEFDSASCIDAFTSITVQGNAAFAAGTKNAPGLATGGSAWVARFDVAFAAGAQPTAQAFINGAELGWFTAADATGVYVSGRAAGASTPGNGFLVKCTLDLLGCAAVPP